MWVIFNISDWNISEPLNKNMEEEEVLDKEVDYRRSIREKSRGRQK